MTYELSATDNGLVRLRAIDPESPSGYVRNRRNAFEQHTDWQFTCPEAFARTFALRQLAPGSEIAALRLVPQAEATR